MDNFGAFLGVFAAFCMSTIFMKLNSSGHGSPEPDPPAPLLLIPVEHITAVGHCRTPQAWHLLYRRGNQWIPVKAGSISGAAKDRFNELEFEPVKTDALRIEVRLHENFSGVILEWTIQCSLVPCPSLGAFRTLSRLVYRPGSSHF